MYTIKEQYYGLKVENSIQRESLEDAMNYISGRISEPTGIKTWSIEDSDGNVVAQGKFQRSRGAYK